MKAPVAKNQELRPPETQREALINLLGDEDPLVYQVIRGKILSYGLLACDWLHTYTLSDDPVLRRRAREIIQLLSRQDRDGKFLHYCQHSGEDLNLEEGTVMLAQTEDPEVSLEGYSALYDYWAGELKDRINFSWDPERILGCLNRYFFEELEFRGDDQYSYHPESSFINTIVDERMGNPIGLCALYLFVARRLCLPVAGIGMPGHFLCRFQSSRKEIYIDAFRGGRFLTKADCIKYLRYTPHGLHQGYLAPVSPRRILSRMCGNIHQTYAQLEMADHSLRVQRYLVALAK